MTPRRKHAVRLVAGRSKAARLAAARRLAAEVGARLGHLDLNRVVSQYIGETEKNLNAVLDKAAEAMRFCFSTRPMRCSANART